MYEDAAIDRSSYCVVRSQRGQFSLWPGDAVLPAGWFHVGFTGDRQACLAHIDELWTELRARDFLASRYGEPLTAATSLSD